MNDDNLKMFVEGTSHYFETVTQKPAVIGAPFLIKDINKIVLNKNDYCYHASTNEDQGKIYAVGGRVLNFVSLLTSRQKFFEKSLWLFIPVPIAVPP